MAHAARIHELGESLVTGITGRTSQDPDFKQILSETTKGLRNSTHARTNQFDVTSKLNGFVEKFSVLNREALAEELQARLDELTTKSGWIPEILSLLLLLSDRPAQKTKLEDLESLTESTENQQILTWKELFADAPVDDSGIWEDVERGYHSSGDEATADEDETISTQATSVADEDLLALARLHLLRPDENCLEEIKNAHVRLAEPQALNITISELMVVRESLAMLQGLPTSIYDVQSSTGKVSPNNRFSLETASQQVLNDTVTGLADLGSLINTLRAWVRQDTQVLYLQSCQASVQAIVQEFGSQLAKIDERFASPQTEKVVSIIDVRGEVELLSKPLLFLSRLVQQSEQQSKRSPFALLDLLYSEACTAQISNDARLTTTLVNVLLAGLRTYLKPVSIWVRDGSLASYDGTFFVIDANKDCELGEIWHERFAMRTLADGRPSVPELLQSLAPRIFALGKSRAVFATLDTGLEDLEDRWKQPLPDMNSLAEQVNSFNLMPLSETLSDILESWIADVGKDCTPLLCKALLHKHGLLQTSNGLAEVFCSKNSRLFQTFADALFWRMDTGKNWIDRFLLTELAQSTLGSAAGIDSDTLTIHANTEQDSLPNSSIAQLETLSLRMLFSWPVQNVTRSKSSASYSKTFTLLLQIYRSKYILRRQVIDIRALDSATRPLPHSVSIALRLRQALVTMVDIFHDHVTSVASMLSVAMQKEIEAADGIDAMADIWSRHEKQLEANLLLTPNFKPLREAIVSLLQLCEQLYDAWKGVMTVVNSRKALDGSDDGELKTGGSDSISKINNLSNLQDDLDKNLSFITAGLRATSRAGGNAALETVADRLEWRGR